jgi:hypothetical protein
MSVQFDVKGFFGQLKQRGKTQGSLGLMGCISET